MPSRNIVKSIAPNSYIHVYNRGVNKEDIFPTVEDKNYFLSLFDRYLNHLSTQTDFDGIPYEKLNKNLEMQCYCIMNNHYHFSFWIGEETEAISKLMRAVGTSYTKYFNTKHDRIGPLFQSRYKAAQVRNSEHLIHLSTYIHLNPSPNLQCVQYEHSSVRAFLGHESPPWLSPHKTIDALAGTDYLYLLRTSKAG